jgi:COP9 signalosome complex subunit 7
MADHMNHAVVAKLEPYLLMSKSAKGAAATKLIQDATSAPGVFVFAELLQKPSIQEVTLILVDVKSQTK